MTRTAVGFNPNISGKEAADYARLAEGRGFESFWVHENPFIKDVVSLMSNAILATNQIKIGSGCVSVITRHPLLVASTFVSLDEMSEGRVRMGVGLGGFPWVPKIGVRVFPVKETKPLKRKDQGIPHNSPQTPGGRIGLPRWRIFQGHRYQAGV